MFQCDARQQVFEGMVSFLCCENRHFFSGMHVTERKLHGESIHLRLGQGIGAAELNWILGGNNEKQVCQVTAFAVHAYLVFSHRLQKGRLGARRSAVDFVGEQDIRKDRPLMEMELLVALAKNRYAENV